mmetsp:Transcript_21380/g.45546  ORF Transcript_21380/g.45546 Transcript_21380/m.45546 type:complete len:418 (+) Transcript_21380:824-2077(+)
MGGLHQVLGRKGLLLLVVGLVKSLSHRIIMPRWVEVAIQAQGAQRALLIPRDLLQLLQSTHDLLLLEVLQPLQLFGAADLLFLLAICLLLPLPLPLLGAFPHRALLEAGVPLNLLSFLHFEAEVVILLKLIGFLKVCFLRIVVLLLAPTACGLHGGGLHPRLVENVVSEELLAFVQVLIGLPIPRHDIFALRTPISLLPEVRKSLLLLCQLLRALGLQAEEVIVFVLLRPRRRHDLGPEVTLLLLRRLLLIPPLLLLGFPLVELLLFARDRISSIAQEGVTEEILVPHALLGSTVVRTRALRRPGALKVLVAEEDAILVVDGGVTLFDPVQGLEDFAFNLICEKFGALVLLCFRAAVATRILVRQDAFCMRKLLAVLLLVVLSRERLRNSQSGCISIVLLLLEQSIRLLRLRSLAGN